MSTYKNPNPDFEHLLPASSHWKTKITDWLQEDIPSFDFGGFVVGDNIQSATLYCKSEGVLCGVPFANEVYNQNGLTYDWYVKEGTFLDPASSADKKIKVCTVSGPVKDILTAERLSLNILCRLSGIATQSFKTVTSARQAGYKGIIAGTRKTTPGLRQLEKYAMLVGGIDPHRNDLSSMIMLKDNHIWATGSITKAVENARKVGGFSIKIEVEVQNEKDADEAIAAGADIIMLDNFQGEQLQTVSKSLRERWSGTKHFLLECSGGLTLQNLAEYLSNDVDIYSTSSVHQGCSIVDFSLKIAKS
ncbi:hypothetical protein OGAPHI_007070 [Ogataea philodendri]|uniref:Nicotinate-nucleotide pyrophosphorylase [carboxylating] n=1 Tax=Ogataea philodendri TaxID=1378263 RepID=A0A9P8SZV0_9ASCO|nr:uncharacterized protein OGAPHI_007070 [Ogataea philodendri]KAH3660484.1 hypothetical protein OGAPHI_007070 [Ogataea philodendri]